MESIVYGAIAGVAIFFVGRKLISAMTKASPPPQIIRRQPAEKRDYTREELKQFDGADPTKPILIGIKGKIFDVSRSAGFYGPGGAYGAFAGRDASRALAKSSTSTEDANSLILDDLTKDELDTLDEWYNHFSMKYEIIGNISDSNINQASKQSEARNRE